MKFFIFVILSKLVFAQDQNIDEAINSIFGTNSSGFLTNYEEVTMPPLKSIGALTKCGEGEQRNQFVCVPYYNCNPETNTVEENSDLDGTNKIDIRMQNEDFPKCDHYLEVCCKLAASLGTGSTGNTGGNGGTTGSTGGSEGDGVTEGTDINGRPNNQRTTVAPVIQKPVTPQEDNGIVRSNQTQRVNCGIRNAQGLDFNLLGQTNEANFGEFPWMVAILRKNPLPNENLAICGGSLIGPRVVLTGAHCVQDFDINTIKIRAGEWDTQTQNERIPYQERNVAQKIIHQHYTKNNLYNDVAILILDRPLTKTDSIGTICLPDQNERFNSRECFATGWGKHLFGQEGRYAVILKKLQLSLVQREPCQTALRKTRLGNSFILHRSFICAGGEPNVDTCTGDGGSPLVCPDPNSPGRYLQVGIVAWGIGCGADQVPGVYVDVASFREWVDLRLQELGINSNSYIL